MDIFRKNIRYIWKNYGIYWAKTIGDIMVYIWQKLWDIFIKTTGIFGKTMGYDG